MKKKYTKKEEIITITAGVFTLIPLEVFELIILILIGFLNPSENNLGMLAIIFKAVGFLMYYAIDIKRVNSKGLPLLVFTSICFIFSSMVYLTTGGSNPHSSLNEAMSDGIINGFFCIIYYIFALPNFIHHMNDINDYKGRN